MKMNRKKFIKLFIISLTATVLFTSCGGGTRGTGPGTRTLRGTLLTDEVLKNLFPATEVDITVTSLDESGLAIDGAQSQTDANGMFEVSLTSFGQSLRFEFISNDLNSSIEVGGIPTDATEGNIEFLSEAGQISVSKSEFNTNTDSGSDSENNGNNDVTEDSTNNGSSSENNSSNNPNSGNNSEEETTPSPTPDEGDPDSGSNNEDPTPTPSPTATPEEEPDLVTICHITGNGKKENTIQVAPEAVDAHLNHGDRLGEC